MVAPRADIIVTNTKNPTDLYLTKFMISFS